MINYEFISDFRSNKHLNTELNQLIKKSCARSTLDDWMLKGNSDPNYQYFGLIDLKGTLIAVVGLIKTSMFFQKRKYSAIQVGNVFFRASNDFSPFEKQRIEHFLLEKVVSKFDTIVDMIYYYHNDESLPLLHDFGLTEFKQHKYYLELDDTPRKTRVVKRVNLDNNSELEELKAIIRHSYQVSRDSFDISSDSVIKIYNILKYYRLNVYKIPSLDVTAVFEIRKDVFKFIAAFSKREINLKEILNAVVPTGIKKVEFAFTPGNQLEGLKIEPHDETSYKETDLAASKLYVKAITVNLEPARVMFPLLSRQK